MSQGEIIDLLKTGSLTGSGIEEAVGHKQSRPLLKLVRLNDVIRTENKRPVWYWLNPERFNV